jgi:lipopolysaccharide heptosyltransferase I
VFFGNLSYDAFPMNILIVKTSAIGDVTHTLPALNCLRQQYPQAHITWLVEEAASDLVLGHPAVDRVLVSRRQKWVKEFRSGEWLGSFRKFLRFTTVLRDRKYDLVFDFQGLLKSSLWVVLSGGRQRVGFGRGMQHAECSYLFLNKRIPAVDMEVHALDRGLLLLKETGVTCPDVVYDLPITLSRRKSMQDLLMDAGFQPASMNLVAINPQTTWWTKLWYSERFSQVADKLVEQGCFVVFTGGPSDCEINKEIQSGMMNHSLNLTGKSSLKELATLYEQADVVISTDTGPMHIAAAMSTPVVALFGPTAPWRTGPYGRGHRVLRTGLACSPCFKRKCPRNHDKECMETISVEQVVQTALEVLAESATRPGEADL